ncbi:MAG TPA: TonB family protein, partial [Marinospirillum sp.]|uniref:TonB family protein n=1 Tax=Marinospirillum sp. TaxID=2183934 RepID=UPI002B48E977
ETQQQSTSSSASRSEFAVSNASDALNLPLPAIDTGLDATATPSLQNLGIDSSADVPVYREAPRYPRQAMARRQEGWVELVFEVDSEGKVLADTIRVVDAEPKHLFERAARRAIARWRFAAYELGSGPNRQLRQRLEFRLEGNQ